MTTAAKTQMTVDEARRKALAEFTEILKTADNELDKASAEGQVRKILAGTGLTKSSVNAVIREARGKVDQGKKSGIRVVEGAAQTESYTDFGGEDEGIPKLKCGDWVCDEQGARTWFRGEVMYACRHPLTVTRRMIDADSGNHFIELAYDTRDGRGWQKLSVKADQVGTIHAIPTLYNYGIGIRSDNAAWAVRYLGELVDSNPETMRPEKAYRRMGWVKEDGKMLCVPYDDVPTMSGSEFDRISEAMRPHGTFEAWQEKICELRIGEGVGTPVRFALAAGLSSLIVGNLDVLPFVVDFWGRTGTGKTVLMKIVTSIFANPEEGKYMTNFQGTVTADEIKAYTLQSFPMILDDSASTDARQKDGLGGKIYRLANGMGKPRGNKAVDMRQVLSWRNVILSTGESELAEFAPDDGAKNRTIEVPIGTKPLFEDPAGLCDFSAENYGTAGPEFVRTLQEIGRPELKKRYERIKREVQKAASGKMEKQAGSLAAILLADEIAVECSLYGDFEKLDVAECIQYLTDKDAGTKEIAIYDRLIEMLSSDRGAFGLDPYSHIKEIGAVKDGVMYVYPSDLKAICKEMAGTVKSFYAVGVERGFVIPHEGASHPGQAQRRIRSTSPWVYEIKLPEEYGDLKSECFIVH